MNSCTATAGVTPESVTVDQIGHGEHTCEPGVPLGWVERSLPPEPQEVLAAHVEEAPRQAVEVAAGSELVHFTHADSYVVFGYVL